MGLFDEAYHALLSHGLVCPKCGEGNRAHASPIVELDQTRTRACCNSCSFEAPIDRFQPKAPA